MQATVTNAALDERRQEVEAERKTTAQKLALSLPLANLAAARVREIKSGYERKKGEKYICDTKEARRRGY